MGCRTAVHCHGHSLVSRRFLHNIVFDGSFAISFGSILSSSSAARGAWYMGRERRRRALTPHPQKHPGRECGHDKKRKHSPLSPPPGSGAYQPHQKGSFSYMVGL